jgi:threonine/homoserine/homoserine lactone efflux protein
MMGVEHLGWFLAAGLLLNLTPGPAVLFVVTTSMRHGVRGGLWAAVGIAAGCFAHIAAAALGVSALLSASTSAFMVLKWVGAIYLMWTGLRLLMPRSDQPAPGQRVGPAQGRAVGGSCPTDWKSIFARGFCTNALNPKVALFFLAFVPQFITPGAPQHALAFLALGGLFNLNGLWVNAGWAFAAAWMSRHSRAVRNGLHALERTAGALFVTFGLKLAFFDSPSH